ncbi:hypothetical protein LPJ53_003909 [Coemansia erecta]|uniref:Extracellular membrane protein CFEM domain-containing protein n=1 Tax=Coemansia erecta TaxID=147472 RepID=A0A9W7Y082_9FUNG|nr:hypothetical protein LPJ53_003909 [Coemansia erecta]
MVQIPLAIVSLASLACAFDAADIPQAPIVAAAPVLVPPTVDILPRPAKPAAPPVNADGDELAQVQMQQREPEGCSLAGQVKLCVNHAAMQRATCASDDLDCQCTWASVTTTCFAPCIADKESSDGMHVAKGDQEAICSQAAKFGKIAKDKERQKQEEKANKGKKKKDEVRTSAPKNIDDMNSAQESSAAAAPEDDDAGPARRKGPDDARDGSVGSGSKGSAGKPSGRNLGGNGVKQVSAIDSGSASIGAGSALLTGAAAAAAGLFFAVPSLF